MVPFPQGWSLLRIPSPRQAPSFDPGIALQVEYVRLFFPVVFGLIGVVLVAFGTSKVTDHRRAVANFVAVDATILESQLDSGPERASRTYSPAISYQYSYDGEEYESSVVHPGGTWATGNEDRMKAIIDEYRPGDQVTAYCDPEHPDQSYLREGKLWHAYLTLGVGVVLVLVSVAIGSTVFLWY